MQEVKRIEIVVPEVIAGDLEELLARHQTGGYTLYRGLGGKGERGFQGAEGVSVDSNSGFVVACPKDRAGALLEDIRTLLKRYGGMCLVSDAMWLRH